MKLGASTGTVVGRGLITGVGNPGEQDAPPGRKFQVTFTFPQCKLFIDVLPGQP